MAGTARCSFRTSSRSSRTRRRCSWRWSKEPDAPAGVEPAVRIALLALVACEQAAPRSEPPAPVPVDARLRTWPVAPHPTLPPELVPWPERLPVETAGGTAHYVDIPSYFPRIWLASDADLRALERAWGPLAREHARSA